jgi:hypothetical protein
MIEVHYCVKSDIGYGWASGSQRFKDNEDFVMWLKNHMIRSAVLVTHIRYV